MLIQLAFTYVHECISSPLIESMDNNSSSNSGGDASFKLLLQEHSFYMDQAILCLKILHKLVLHGFRDNVDSVPLNQLMFNLMQSLEKLITKHNTILVKSNQTLIDYFKEKYEYLIVLYVQIISDYQETYPFNFIQTCMNDCFNIIIQICFTPQV